MKTILFAAAVAAFASATPASAAQIVLGASNIVGATPSINDSQFGVSNIFDAQVGAIAPEGIADGSFWLAQGVSPDVFITVDLGAVYSDLSFDFFNTHNAVYYDRGIGAFEIFASNTLVSAGANGFTLGSATRLIGGTLAAEGDDIFQAQTFASDSPVGYRYIQLRPRSVASARQPNSPHAYGLNELRIFGEPGGLSGAVPEPATWAMMILGFGLSGALLRRRSAIAA